MKYWLVALALTTALAGVPLHAQASNQVQFLRSDTDGGKGGMLPFTTYTDARKQVLAALPCKWVSIDGHVGPSYGGKHYDFICKGGDWGTISLFLDKSGGYGDGLGGVRLLYRAWKSQVNPNAGEAFIAEKFLQHVAGHFIPASIAGEAMEAFWGTRSGHWSANDTDVSFSVEDGPQFVIHKLEIKGTASSQVEVPHGLKPAVAGAVMPLPDAAGLSKEPPHEQPVRIVPQTMPVRAHVGTEGPLPVAKPITPVLPKPVELPVPGSRPAIASPEGLMVPDNAPAGPVSPSLPKASPSELNTAPAPESLVKPAPPPAVSSTLAPGVQVDGVLNQRAPSNFDDFNKAMDLTKDVQQRAQTLGKDGKPEAAPAPTPEQKAQATASKPEAAAPAKPVATPATPSAPAAPAVNGGVVTIQGNDYIIGKPPVRPLPQLKFVPKAEPLKDGNSPIQFEDEKSTL